MLDDLVVKGYYVMKKITDKYGTREKQISRVYHVRDSAVEFCAIANAGIPEDGNRATVREKVGKEPPVLQRG